MFLTCWLRRARNKKKKKIEKKEKKKRKKGKPKTKPLCLFTNEGFVISILFYFIFDRWDMMRGKISDVLDF